MWFTSYKLQMCTASIASLLAWCYSSELLIVEGSQFVNGGWMSKIK